MGSQAGQNQQVKSGFQIWSDQELGMAGTAAQTVCQIPRLETGFMPYFFIPIKTTKKKQSAMQSPPTLVVLILSLRSNG